MTPSSTQAHRQDAVTDQVFRQASDWFARERSGTMTSAERAELAQWRLADPLHARAWEEVNSLWAMTATVADEPEVQTLRAQAHSRRSQGSAPSWGGWAFGAASLAASALIAVAFFGGVSSDAPHIERESIQVATRHYMTVEGAHDAIILEDGSDVLLDAATRLRAQISQDHRNIDLIEGRARFDVRHSQDHRFTVSTPLGEVHVLGTRFDVSYRGTQMDVLLYEGVLDVYVEGRAQRLSSGQSIQITDQGLSQAMPLSPDAGLWSDGVLMFRATPLAEVAAEVSRQSSRDLNLAFDPLEDETFTGRLNAGEIEPAAQAIAAIFGLEMTREPGGDIILSRETSD